MTGPKDPIETERLRLRRRLFILIAISCALIVLLVWMTITVLDVNGIDAFDVIAMDINTSFALV